MQKIEENCRDRYRKFFMMRLQESWEHISRAETAGCPMKGVNLCLEGGEEAVPRLEQAEARLAATSKDWQKIGRAHV